MTNSVKTLIRVAIFCLAFSLPDLKAKSFYGIYNGLGSVIKAEFFCAPYTSTPNPGATTRNPAKGWSEVKELFAYSLTNAASVNYSAPGDGARH